MGLRLVFSLFPYLWGDRMALKDLTGMQFEHFKVIERLPNKNGRTYWKCKCECGTYFNSYGKTISNGTRESCGCVNNERNKKRAVNYVKDKNNADLTGQQYGYLKVLGLSPNSTRMGSVRIWSCKCELCGSIKDYVQHILPKITSCGCYKNKLASNRIKDVFGIVDGTNVSVIAKDTINTRNTSGVRGISWHKKTSKWHAYIGFRSKVYSLGYFSDLNEAVAIRKLAEKEVFGDFLKWYKKEYPDKWEKFNK